MCQFTVRWLLRRDTHARLLFAAQQEPVAAAIFGRHGLGTEHLNSAALVSGYNTPRERVTLRSDAILASLTVLGRPWSVLAGLARLVPRPIRNLVYGFIARNRIRLFGTADVCALPTPAERARFLGA